MPNQSSNIAVTFNALSDPTRQAVVAALSDGPASVSQLAAPFDMALPSFTQHLGVLEEAGLIVSERQGRKRICSLNAATLQLAEDWLATHRRRATERLDRLEAHLERLKKETADD